MSAANESAFPLFDPGIPGTFAPLTNAGLTKREYFAAMAMQGLVAALSGIRTGGSYDTGELGIIAVEHADALLAALDSPQ